VSSQSSLPPDTRRDLELRLDAFAEGWQREAARLHLLEAVERLEEAHRALLRAAAAHREGVLLPEAEHLLEGLGPPAAASGPSAGSASPPVAAGEDQE
jgi:hypothetical protein